MKERTSNYFTFVVYPEEVSPDILSRLFSLGSIYTSPLHNPNIGDTGIVDGLLIPKKIHSHFLFKLPYKTTYNGFVEYLCNNGITNFNGIAIHKEDCVVYDVCKLLRYFYHFDYPNKEQFSVFDVLNNSTIGFCDEVAKAFDNELRVAICQTILTKNVNSVSDLISTDFFNNSFVIQKWLTSGRNLYLISTLFKERHFS